METGLSLGAAALQSRSVEAPKADPRNIRVGESQSGKNEAAVDKAANEFESVFIGQMMSAMFSGIKSDGITGGGEGEEMFRSLMTDQYAKSMQANGGIGLAAQVKAQMLKMQEMHHAG